jgi:hypothetical protein
MKAMLLGWCCLLLSGGALAAAPDAKPLDVQASMLLTGSITVTRDGHVAAYAIDKADKVPPVVMKLLAQAVPNWRFEPVLRDGKPVMARSPMNLRIVAKSTGGGKFSISVAGARFGDGGPSNESLSYKRRTPPRYPKFAMLDRASGTAYLLVRVNRQGLVDDLAVEQVNLTVTGSPSQMKRWRQEFADATLRAAKNWTFNVPTAGTDADDDYLVARIAVNFRLHGFGIRPAPGYGHWQPYIPGPRQPVPWVDADQLAASADVLPAGGIASLDQSLHLLTGLGG